MYTTVIHTYTAPKTAKVTNMSITPNFSWLARWHHPLWLVVEWRMKSSFSFLAVFPFSTKWVQSSGHASSVVWEEKKTDKTYCRTNTFPFNRSSYKIFMSFNKGVGRDDLIVSSQKKWNYQNMNPPWNMIKYRFNFSTSILILASDYLRSMKFLRISCSKYYIKCYVKETLQWYCLFFKTDST